VPPQKISYNKAAGADARERDLKSYVLGYYKSERGETGFAAKPAALREVTHTYAVILARFRNEGFQEHVTLAQVFSFKDAHGQPARFYVVADGWLTISQHFSGFGSDINTLKKKLRSMPGVEVHDTFPPYGASFRRRFGIDTEQALDLFHQTVSMKSVGNLTDFVRHHMLEAFPVEARINALMAHFDNLNRAHEAVLKAKAQIERLLPLIADCDEHAKLMSNLIELRDCRDALHVFFANTKAELLTLRCESLKLELNQTTERIASLEETESSQRDQRDQIKQSIAENGGDRIENLKKEITGKEVLKKERMVRADQYIALARTAGMPDTLDAATFVANCAAIASASEGIETRRGETQHAITEESVTFKQLKTEHEETCLEIESLRKRRSNIPAHMLSIRDNLCRDLRVDEERFPFAGELIQVRDEESAWEGQSNAFCTTMRCHCSYRTKITRASQSGSSEHILGDAWFIIA
jgi:uncharacterized protein YPO0396